MHRFPFTARTLRASLLATLFGLLVGAASLPSPASADRVYHSQHLDLIPVGDAPLRSGFVENIKAQGPTVYAHEIFVLNGASPLTTYTVLRDFYFHDPDCSGEGFPEFVTMLETNAAGNGRGFFPVPPEFVAGFEGVSGVIFVVTDETGTVRYRTACTAVTLD